MLLILIAVCLVMPIQAQWAKLYPGGDNDTPRAMQVTSEGDLLVAGISWDGSAISTSDQRAWIMKITDNGLEAQRWVLNSLDPQLTHMPKDQVLSLEPAGDGGFIVAGYIDRAGESLEQSEISNRKYAFFVKLTPDLDVEWQRFYGQEDDVSFCRAFNIKPLQEGGYGAVGSTTAFGVGGQDLLVMKLNALGQSIWQKTYGGKGDDEARLFCPMPDGGFLIVGRSNSFHEESYEQVWVLRLNFDGAIVWQRTYGYSELDRAHAVALTPEGGCWIAGETRADRGEENSSDQNILLMELNAEGQVVFHRSFGNLTDESVHQLILKQDGSFLAVGSQKSGDDQNILIMEFASTGHLAWLATFGEGEEDGYFSLENGQTLALGAEEEIYVAGSSSRMGASGDDLLVLKLTQDGRIPNCSYMQSLEKLPFTNFGAFPKNTVVEFLGAENLLQSFEFSRLTSQVESQSLCASKNNLIRR